MGGQTVTLRSFTNGVTRDRLNQPEKVATDVTVAGCLMRPYRPTEQVTLTDVATEVWRCTAPPVTAALNATAANVLLYQGNTYQIIGVEPFPDLSGVIDHVRITCQLQAL
jgi:hypothetical protein